jgi:DNA-binding transcriptional regulator PaaX
VREARFPLSVVAVGLVLSTYADVDGTNIRPSQVTVADGLGIDRSTVGRGIARLRADGYLGQVREPSPGRTTEYRLTLPVRAVLHGERAVVHGEGAVLHGERAVVHGEGAVVQQHQTSDQNKDQTTYQNSDQTTGSTTAVDPWPDDIEQSPPEGPDGPYRSRYLSEGCRSYVPAWKRDGG